MSKRTNVEVLFDSVYTINQALGNSDNNSNGQRGVLKANADHIKLCLGKEEYTSVLTPEQTDQLNQAVVAAEAKIETLPVPEGEFPFRIKTKVAKLSA